MIAFEAWLLSYLLNSLWQIPLLFAAGWLAARAIEPLGPAAEHRLWVGVLLLQTLLPAASALPPRLYGALSVGLGTLLAFLGRAPHALGTGVSVITGAGSGRNALHLPPGMLTLAACAYAAATAYFAARFLWRCNQLRTLRRESTPIRLTGEAALCWAQCRERFAIESVCLASSSRVRGPVTIGLTRKLLLLPATMMPGSLQAGLPEPDLRTVIAHEFAHMRRNDFVKNLVYELLALPARYHPALWAVRERLTETREIVCDRMAARPTVVKSTPAPSCGWHPWSSPGSRSGPLTPSESSMPTPLKGDL